MSQQPAQRNVYGIRRNVAQSNKKGLFKNTRLLFVIAALVVIVIVITVVTINMLNQPISGSLEDVKESVSRHFVLPSDEQPALATIVDKNKVRSDFFKQAENNDQVLIYQKNKTAIIYRPSIDRIIAIGPVSIDTPKNGVQ